MHLCHAGCQYDRFDSVKCHNISIASAAAFFCFCLKAESIAGIKHSLYKSILIVNIEAHIVCFKLDLKRSSHLVAGILQTLFHVGCLSIQLVKISASYLGDQHCLLRNDVCRIFCF